ncbi:MAG TPA: hypothetical protein VG056_07575 [Pirellulales bacterium]|jgi:hypothetical protein|nr:hypothetical protein [Pirellulales bacterium]
MLTIEQIKAAHGPKEFTVKAWGGDVRIRRLTAGDWIDYNALPDEMSAFDKLVWLIERCAVNENDSPLFTADTRYLLTDSPLIASRLGNEIIRLNRLEDSEKNSPASP